MENERRIYLKTGAVLTMDKDSIICESPLGERIYLTAGQQRLLKKLAEYLNRPLAYDLLYTAYANEDHILTYTGGINSNIAKMKRTFPACIRTEIKNTRNLGYRLEGTFMVEETCKSETKSTSYLAELTGEYYGFYLDPLGSGAVLGAYFYIENRGSAASPEMAVAMISGIRSRDMLLSATLRDIFFADTTSYQESFRGYKETLSENDKRCSFSEGTITLDHNLAVLQLHMKNYGKWEIFLDLENYLKGNRKKEEAKDYYRGGLGLVVATNTFHGTYCQRFGMIRNLFIKEHLWTKEDKMTEMLKLLDGSRQADWKPLKLSGWLDKCWYNWMMDT